MARASKRITRKQIKQPDWFQIHSEQALDFIAEHKPLVAGAVVALVLIGVANWSWQQFKYSQNITAAQEYSKAVSLYQTEKYRDAIAAFEKVQTYRWSNYSPLAHIYLANSFLAINEADKALAAGQRSVSATKPNSLYRQIALIVLARAEERKSQCKAAIEHYNDAQKISGALQSNAMLGKARCAEQLGDNTLAIATYKDYMKENPGSPFALKLAELEAKSPAPKPAK